MQESPEDQPAADLPGGIGGDGTDGQAVDPEPSSDGSDPGTIEAVHIEDQMRTAYLDYALSVIVGRAFPDARDGLKPVQRRVLYTMHEEGIRANTAYKK